MNRALFILIALCALTTALVPRDKREEPKICAPTTPCGWSIYKPVIKIIEVNISNTYCNCKNGTTCQISEDDTSAYAWIHHCL